MGHYLHSYCVAWQGSHHGDGSQASWGAQQLASHCDNDILHSAHLPVVCDGQLYCRAPASMGDGTREKSCCGALVGHISSPQQHPCPFLTHIHTLIPAHSHTHTTPLPISHIHTCPLHKNTPLPISHTHTCPFIYTHTPAHWTLTCPFHTSLVI